MDYTSTLNLPSTEFSMRANLPAREPVIQEKWNSDGLYNALLEKNKGKTPFILHDGPPFSNGNIHMGTAMNKVLKDFIVKYKNMNGFYSPYIPGWDNHGMPIESAIIKKNKLDRKKMSVAEFRRACHKFAADFVAIQMSQFKRLGVCGDWEHPYLTMNPSFESREVRVFGEMFKKGYIYKGLKPVYWCAHDETALAEAEIEYSDDKCESIYVKFAVSDDKGKFTPYTNTLEGVYFVIWTTTTWTLPGNVAICLGPDIEYSLIDAGGDKYIVATELISKVAAEYTSLATFKGRELEGLVARHPFFDRDSHIIIGDHVTLESGTGCVHTAPGHGVEDYAVCRKYDFLDIVVPVDDRGRMNSLAGKYEGLTTEECNTAILADMRESGALLKSETIEHQYPHCWRCKSPIVFRATPQWFCSVDAFKEEAVAACKDVEWIPAWGGERITQMVRERADWCISRQRHWGLPIPVFYCEDCKKVICNDDTINAVSKIFAEKGSNAWFESEAADLLPEGYKCPFCGSVHFTKEKDTLDGWFDSGSSHFAVLENNPDTAIKRPADLYLEGADQYRGWFQSSLLTSVAAKGDGAPYKSVLTHGWVVDGEGKAMHKSLGNAIAPESIIDKYGADILRLWVASSDYRVDVRVSDPIFKQLCETYRKIRNTSRMLLANLGTKESDFNPDRDMLPVSELYDLDKWALSRLGKLIKAVRAAYDGYDFHYIYHDIKNFCTIDMSKLYIDIVKDRVYVEKKDSTARRSAQTAMYIILSAMTRMLAPVLSHTAEEVWQSMSHISGDDARSVFLNPMPCDDGSYEFPETAAHWDKLFELRDDVMKALEEARADKQIGKSLEAKVKITASGEKYELLSSFADSLAAVFIVSDVELIKGEGDEMKVLVSIADGEKCDRCWMHSTDGEHTEDGYLCKRCKNILSL